MTVCSSAGEESSKSSSMSFHYYNGRVSNNNVVSDNDKGMETSSICSSVHEESTDQRTGLDIGSSFHCEEMYENRISSGTNDPIHDMSNDFPIPKIVFVKKDSYDLQDLRSVSNSVTDDSGNREMVSNLEFPTQQSHPNNDSLSVNDDSDGSNNDN